MSGNKQERRNTFLEFEVFLFNSFFSMLNDIYKKRFMSISRLLPPQTKYQQYAKN